ncbi:MAG: hypothetical protein EXR76_16195 [Myxococcales bacterium]|nr:hypothetical protein [Myxococcales bacterium]
MKTRTPPRIRRPLFAVPLLLTLSACPGFGDRLPTGEGVTYESHVAGIMEAHCTRCHSAPPSNGAPFPLVTFEQVSARAERIKVRTYDLRTMPLGGDITDEERESLFVWWSNGSPESPGESPAQDRAMVDATVDDAATEDMTTGPAPDSGADEGLVQADVNVPSGPTWEGEVEAVFARACGTCHSNPPVAGAPFPLVTYDEVVSHASRVKARAIDERTMPLGAPLSESDFATMEAWLGSGTPQ